MPSWGFRFYAGGQTVMSMCISMLRMLESPLPHLPWQPAQPLCLALWRGYQVASIGKQPYYTGRNHNLVDYAS